MSKKKRWEKAVGPAEGVWAGSSVLNHVCTCRGRWPRPHSQLGDHERKKNFYSFYLFCCLRKKGGGRRELNKKRERERVCFLGCLATNRTTIHSLETRRRKNLKRVAGRKCARNKAPMDVIVDVSGRRQNFSLISLLTPSVNGRPVWTDEKGTKEQADEERNSSLALLMRDGYARTNLERVDERQDHWPRRHAAD